MDPFGPTLRRTRRRERPGLRALAAVVLSLALNALVVTQLDASWLVGQRAGPRREVAIAPLKASDWEANRRIGAAPPPSRFVPPPPVVPAQPPPPPREEIVPPGQLVQLDDAPQAKHEVPKDSRYVSDRDQVVAKETKARLDPNADGVKRPAPIPIPRAEAIGEGGQDTRSAPGALGAKGAKAPEPARQERVARATTDGQPVPGRGELPRPSSAWAPSLTPPGGGGEGGAVPLGERDHRLDLQPSTVAKVLGRRVGDKLDDVEEGEGNFLSTRSWKYATYFNRIKESVGQSWRPNKEIQKRDPDGSLYFFKDRLTVLSVTLDQTGALKDVRVVRSSSVDFLDKVAVEAFQHAQPFTNPPAGLVNERGEITYTLGFEVYGARPGLHLFRGSYPP